MSTPYVRPSSVVNENEPETVHSILRDKYERCTFCNSRMVFNHDLNLHLFEVVETGRCPTCGVHCAPKKFALN